ISPAYAVTVNPIPAAPVVTNSGYTAESDALAGNQWYFNGTLIAGANDQTYDATLSGTGFYWSVVTLNNCSSDTSNHKYIVVTGVNEPKTGMISVYPNPNDGQFRVKLSSIKQASFNISVINNMGLKINEIRDIVVIGNIEKNIDLRPVPAGIYSVVIKNSESTVVKKIVINK
ncbi:MAG TPA: T9SS type A sorting domain-containing protein, partial [Bacteroidales bacterium]|nr:T9SS type A sorting domain-containing protein [Bacteroidales bacterium]